MDASADWRAALDGRPTGGFSAVESLRDRRSVETEACATEAVPLEEGGGRPACPCLLASAVAGPRVEPLRLESNRTPAGVAEPHRMGVGLREYGLGRRDMAPGAAERLSRGASAAGAGSEFFDSKRSRAANG